MLILTRTPGKSVYIGEEIVVTVLGVKGNQVRFGFEAPPDVEIHREEIYERVQRERATAAESQSARAPTPVVRSGQKRLIRSA